ncbi:MAG: type II secretion system protein [Candidatus Hydrogenedentota bacterium]|nr:MAG: type II secretion system protein [Candidatus Hydrogenedentota bacterium]
MEIRERKAHEAFTLIEVAVALGVLGALTLVIATLMLRTIDTYGQVTSETDTTKQARYCLEMISRELRESVNTPTTPSIVNPAAGAPMAAVQDALLLTSARQSDDDSAVPPKGGEFILDVDNFPDPQSIVLFYLNTTPEGITQLVRHQLYYDEDLSVYASPFALAANPYVDPNIVVVDNAGTVININRTTGAVAGTPPFRPPKVLMNRTMSFDIVDTGIDPIEARITCQTVDRYGRTATARLSSQIEPRNL